MADLSLIKSRLAANLEGILPTLLPAGRKVGHEYVVGSTNGEAGTSLKIDLRPGKGGVWCDFANPDDGNRGDIIDLFCAVRGQRLIELLPELSRLAGLAVIDRPRRRAKPPPPDRSSLDRLRGTPEFDYVRGRGIAEETMRLYRIRRHYRPPPVDEFNKTAVAFTFLSPTGEVVMLKSTGINPKIVTKGDGRRKVLKDVWSTTPWSTLWGWWLVSDRCPEICITEGEWDAMSLHQLEPGMPVLSMPSGADNLDWIDNDWDRLMLFERVFLCTDMDVAGEKAAQAIAKRLGRERVFRVGVPAPAKDANEAITTLDPDKLEWSTWEVRNFTPETLQGPSMSRDASLALLKRRRQARERNDFMLPRVPFQWRAGECTVVSGMPGGGKSAFLYQSIVHEALVNGRTCLSASFEISPPEQIVEMTSVMTGENPTEADIDKAIDLIDGRVWFYVAPESPTLGRFIEDALYAAKRFGVWLIIVDSLFFLAPKEAYEAQDNVSLTLTNFAKQHEVCIALVCHSIVKGDGERIPGMGQVEGSGGICKPVDNGLTIHRNLAKLEDDAPNDLHDGNVRIWKQRSNGVLKTLKLWFDPASKRFRTEPQAIEGPTILRPHKGNDELF